VHKIFRVWMAVGLEDVTTLQQLAVFICYQFFFALFKLVVGISHQFCRPQVCAIVVHHVPNLNLGLSVQFHDRSV